MLLLKSVQKKICHLFKLSLVCAASVSSQAHSSMTYCSTLCGLPSTPLQTASSNEAKVYCSTANKNWAYLANGNVKVTGSWKTKIVGTFNHIYFIIDGGEQAVLQLQNACKNEFGQNYLYAQPENKNTNSWHTFAINDNTMASGHFLLQLRVPPRL